METIWHSFHIRLQQYLSRRPCPACGCSVGCWQMNPQSPAHNVLQAVTDLGGCWVIEGVSRLLHLHAARWPPLSVYVNSPLAPLWCTQVCKQERLSSQPMVDPRIQLWNHQQAHSGLTLFQRPELFKYEQVIALLLPKTVTHPWDDCACW